MPSKKVSSIEEVYVLSKKMDVILAYINKQNVENVHELVGNSVENVDVNFVRNFGNNGYGNNYNSYNKPPYASNNYGNHPFIAYPNANENKWKPTINDHSGGQQETNRNLMEQVAGHSTMIEELNKSIDSISFDIKGLQTQAAGLEKALSNLADNQVTLLSISAGKPQAPPVIGMNSVVIIKNTPLTLEEMLEELKNYPKFLLPFVSQLVCLEKEVKEIEEDDTIMIIKEKKVEEVKMLSEVKDPLLDLEKCSLRELMSILQKFASDPSINANQAGFCSYIANHVLKEKIARYNQEAMIPPKLGDAWIPKVLVTIEKETHHAILDLGSSVSVLSKELYELLELQNIEKCSIDLLLADDSIKHALGKVSNIMVELHMTFVPIDFIIMDMGIKPPILLFLVDLSSYYMSYY
jgi:hypothetical protein